MSNSTAKTKMKQINTHKKSLLEVNGDISLTKILNTEACQTILSECREFRERLYTPIKTIFMFVKQALSPDKSCKNAVANAVVEQACAGERLASINTGPYCKARKRLPTDTLYNLVRETGKAAALSAPAAWNWQGRPVKLVDGTTITMPDTEKNQHKFPQHGNQKTGVGTPIMRLVAVMSLGAGTVLDYAFTAHKGKGTGEHALFRQVIDCIKACDVLLGDCYYPSFFFDG